MSRLIVFEGIDGAGKTTISRMLVSLLEKRGLRVYYTYEPFDSPFTEVFRRVKESVDTGPVIDTLAMALDRAYHMRLYVEPMISRGYIVVMDRYFYSTIAYQGAMGGDTEWIRCVNSVFRRPDIAFYIDVSIETAMKRIAGKKSRWPYYEVSGLLERVREIYLGLVRSGELVYIDGERDAESVFRDVLNILCEKRVLPREVFENGHRHDDSNCPGPTDAI